MSQTVTFETAKRLKAAGFPQPEFAVEQFWYVAGKIGIVVKFQPELDRMNFSLLEDSGADLIGIEKIENLLPEMVFAPTATDIIREFERLQKSKWIRLGMSGEDWYCYLYAALSGLTDRFPHENPAEACAEAWLKHKE